MVAAKKVMFGTASADEVILARAQGAKSRRHFLRFTKTILRVLWFTLSVNLSP